MDTRYSLHHKLPRAEAITGRHGNKIHKGLRWLKKLNMVSMTSLAQTLTRYCWLLATLAVLFASPFTPDTQQVMHSEYKQTKKEDKRQENERMKLKNVGIPLRPRLNSSYRKG